MNKNDNRKKQMNRVSLTNVLSILVTLYNDFLEKGQGPRFNVTKGIEPSYWAQSIIKPCFNDMIIHPYFPFQIIN